MMRKLHSGVFIFFLTLFSNTLFATDLRVTTLANAGPGSLRDQIAAATASDRVVIDIKGTIQLTSPIFINSGVEIVGPFPIHSKIDFSLIGLGSAALDISTAAPVRIRGISFDNISTSANVKAIHVGSGSNVEITDCVFERGTGDPGGALNVEGTVNATNCSFISNTSVGEGGAVFIFNSGNATFVNCTFGQNNATQHGGAVRVNSATAKFVHCTFAQNTTGATGADISVFGATSSINMQNNIVDNTIDQANSMISTSAPLWISQGGNVFSMANPTAIGLFGNDLQGEANIFLGPLKTDGYGLEYYPISSAASNAIDHGTAGTLPSTDCRRAPRIMEGNFGSAIPDAGAVEYTRYTVSNNAVGGAGSLAAAINNINSFGQPGPMYVDFNIPGISTINISATLVPNKPVIIDGYTNQGSMIPGPGVVSGQFTPPNVKIFLDGLASTTVGLMLNVNSSNSSVFGVGTQNFSSAGISVSGGSNSFFAGNVFINNLNSGLEIAGATAINVGDTAYHQTNIFTGNTLRGVFVNGSTFVRLKNNIIGTDFAGIGFYAQPQAVGVEISGAVTASVNIGGTIDARERNVITANTSHQVLFNNNSNTSTVSGNFIGVNYLGNSALNSFSYGISVTTGATAITVGGTGPKFRNIIGGQGNGGVLISAASGNTVIGNLIGISDLGGMIQVANGFGIQLLNAGTSSNSIGSLTGRNYICGNTASGIDVQNCAGDLIIKNNFIGVLPNGVSFGNGSHGISLMSAGIGNVIGGPAGEGNLISDNGGDGIVFNATSGANTIDGNIIGLDSLAISSFGNTGNGIALNASSGAFVKSNVISGNSGTGIVVASDNTIVQNNIIGTDPTLSGSFANGSSGIIVTGSSNFIGGTPAQQNIIAFNIGAGISSSGAASVSNSYLSNLIYDNTGLGIDLVGNMGVDGNDATDSDGGPNNLQNFPDNLSASQCGSSTTISGSFYATSSGTNYVIQFFHIPAGGEDPSGHGEGTIYLGESLVTSGAVGTFYFTYTHTSLLPVGDFVSATLSREVAVGTFETSEFSGNALIATPVSNSVVSTDVTCNGANDGTATVTTSNGVAPYSYQWYDSGMIILAGQTSNVASFLAPGNYICVVTDASGCNDTTTAVTIVEPPVITGSIAITSPTCSGNCDGSVIITAAGGTGMLEYSQNGGGSYQASATFSAYCAGITSSFFVRDANLCFVDLGTANITQPAPLVISPTLNHESCANVNDGSISILESGGTPTYNYSIDNGSTFQTFGTFSNLPAGNYDLVVKDTNNCTVSQSVTLNALVTPTALFTTPTACVNQGITITDLSTITSGSVTSWNWTLPTASPSSASVQNMGTVLFFTAGSHPVTLISGDGTCNDTITLNITVNASPVIDAGVNDSICSGNSYSQIGTVFSGAAPYSFSWTPAGDFVTATIQNPVTTTSLSNGNHLHYFTVTDNNGCIATDSMTLNVLAPPTVNAGTNITVCANNSLATISGTSSTGSGNWTSSGSGTFANATALSTTYTPSAADISAGTIALTLTATNTICTAPVSTITLTIIPAPTVSAGAPVAVCSTFPTVALSATFSGSTGMIWSGGGGTFTPANTNPNATYVPTAAEISAGTVTLYATNTGTGICNAELDSAVITIDPQPTVFAGNDTTVCASNNIVPINAVPSTGSGAWTTTGSGTFANSTLNGTTYTASAGDIASGSTNLIFTTSANGACAAEDDTLTITLLPSPAANAGANGTVCPSTAFTLDGSLSISSVNYSWYQLPGPVLISNTITASVAPATTTDYVLIVDNGAGCSDQDTITVTVLPFDNASFSYSVNPVCSAVDSIQVTAVTPGTYIASGASINGTTGTVYINGLTPTGTYTIYHTTTGSCPATDSVSLTVNPSPNPSFFYSSSTFCAAGTTTPTVTGLTGGTFGVVPVTGLSINSTSGTVNLAASSIGTYGVVYSVSNGSCTNSDTFNITISVGQDPNIIYGLSLNDTAHFCLNGSNPLPTFITTAGGIFSSSTLTLNSSTGEIFLSSASAGTHNIIYQTSLCGETDTVAIVLHNTPTIPSSPQISFTYCPGQGIVPMSVNAPGNGELVEWYNDSGLSNLVGNGLNFTPPTGSGVVNYYAVLTLANCQGIPLTFTVTFVNASIDAGPDQMVCPGEPVQLNVTGASGAVVWIPGSTLSDSTITNPIAIPLASSYYHVITSVNGCMVMDSVLINLSNDPNCEFYINNAFSPDFDGVNDTWIIEGAFTHPDNRVVIFNRWGNELVSFDNYDNVTVVWDGTYKGSSLPSGTYYYTIFYRSLNRQQAGWVQITR